MTATEEPVVVTDDGPVRVVMIDRPSRRNAVDPGAGVHRFAERDG